VLASVKATADALTPWPSLAPMRELLASVIRNGTGNAARLPIPAYGKTGTTQNHRDALFIGYAGDLVVGVWVGNDDNSPMNGVVGGSVPARTWRRFMQSALAADKAANTPRRRQPAAEAIGDLVETVAGPEAGAAADAVADVVVDAEAGTIDAPAVADAAARVEDAIAPPPEPAPPQ
jgi:penicillin-binding protein 1A